MENDLQDESYFYDVLYCIASVGVALDYWVDKDIDDCPDDTPGHYEFD